MTNTLLYIRSRQIKREIDGLGFYVFFFLAVTCILSFITFIQYKNNEKAWYIVLLLTLVCTAVQSSRTDKLFIYKQFERPHLQLFLEYTVLTLPFSITSVFTQNWFCFPLLLSALLCIPFLKFQSKRRAVFKNLSSIIPASNFEWISGFRKQYVAFICLYLAAVIFCWVRILPLALLWLLTIMISSFHLENEPVHILREGNKTAGRFLSGKIKSNITYLLILYSFPVVLNAVFVGEFLTIILLFIPVQVALLCFAITLKYSTYNPLANPLGNNVVFSIIAILSAVPYLLPIPAILAIVYFFKAETNLKSYLHD